MAKPRKKWEPEYRFGGNLWSVPKPLGDNHNPYKLPKNKKRKRK